jgi:hypothetical protein
MQRRHIALVSWVTIVCLSAPSFAQEPTSAESPEVVTARREFLSGAELVKQERWAEALAAFERASSQKAHAITSFNIAQCERALGQYTRARRSLLQALEQDRVSNETELPPNARNEARGMLDELERILIRVTVNLRPEEAALAVDGRPLERAPEDGQGTPLLVAGTHAPGPGAPIQLPTFRVLMNPGAHVFIVSQRGYQDIVLNRSFPPGASAALDLSLDKLPATIHLTSDHPDAIVRVNGVDVGNPPVEVSRAAGRYKVTVTRAGFVPYDADVAVRSGERVELDAKLREDRPALTQRWWFWTAAGALVIGAATTTYLLTRSEPEPTRPPTNGGGLGWSLKVPQ